MLKVMELFESKHNPMYQLIYNLQNTSNPT